MNKIVKRPCRNLLLTGCGALLLMLAQMVSAADRLELDEGRADCAGHCPVQGASELPKVLYIVPWKKAEIGDKPVKVNRLVDEVLSPVDRDVLKREIRFYEQAQAE